METFLSGRRVHIAGSLFFEKNSDLLVKIHSLVKKIAENIFLNGGGLIISIGSEPLSDSDDLIPLIFDWELLDSFCKFIKKVSYNWPENQGAPIIAVGFHDYLTRIPKQRLKLWKECQESGCIELKILPKGQNYGGLMRRTQSKYGDLLLTIGGSVGVYDLVELYQLNKKHIIPFDIKISSKKSASEEISEKLFTNPESFFRYKPAHNASLLYSKLTFKHGFPEEDDFISALNKIFKGLTKPLAFYIRVLNTKSESFSEVDTFFRNTVDPICNKMGYERYEAGTDGFTRGFMNVDIFEKLHYSSLIFVDLTDLRSNCFFEYGYALGRNKKIICMAKEDTKMPWDTTTLPCHFWSKDEDDVTRIEKLENFMKLNINRSILVGE